MGSYTSALSAHDRAEIEAAFEHLLEELPYDPGAIDLARERHAALFADWENGDEDAGRMIRGLVLDGLIPHANRVLKAPQSQIKLSGSERIVTLSARRGVRKVDENGVSLKAYQQSFFWELRWPQFMEMVDDLTAQRDRLSINVAALHVVANLRLRFPDTATPFEACERAGIDPMRIGFDSQVA